jgi:uncharacterized protein (TIGR04255 family)
MKHKYKQPPVVEALIELQFDESAPDPGAGPRMYEAWKGDVKHRETMMSQHIHFSLGPQPAPPPAPPPTPTDRLWFDVPRWVVQVGPGILSVHIVEQPYPGAEIFRPLFAEALKRYLAIFEKPPTQLKRAAMRYLNRLNLPLGEDGNVAPWLNVGVSVPASLEQRVNGFTFQIHADISEMQAGLICGLRTGAATETEQEVLLDLLVQSSTNPVPIDALDEWLDRAHDEIVAAFEGSITDEARSAFGVYDAP